MASHGCKADESQNAKMVKKRSWLPSVFGGCKKYYDKNPNLDYRVPSPDMNRPPLEHKRETLRLETNCSAAVLYKVFFM